MLRSLTQYINNNFGSKKGALCCFKYLLLQKLGAYNRYKAIDFKKVERLVFICSGNICRSSFAEYAAQKHGIAATSYGLHCRGGDPADPRAMNFASNKGLDMSGHTTRNIKDYIPEESDLVVVMEPKHLEPISRVKDQAQVTIAPLWCNRQRAYLHDPFSSNLTFFEKCEEILWEAIEELGKYVKART